MPVNELKAAGCIGLGRICLRDGRGHGAVGVPAHWGGGPWTRWPLRSYQLKGLHGSVITRLLPTVTKMQSDRGPRAAMKSPVADV